ncbi:hypothetical protein [Mycolicibacterium chlorophenolicum]|uniref:Uncharacterized protein n=1 Tax=Mycolicibacterium chlorophenolicum TaxID=37916 RepID=A0A0J6WL27_9MYCO|nr:hypothetical protein [Mycolicibacterium chlorophenolicum]KMO82412.1 hypothetical protein MCHLDSM_01035 [Mycolicibacterium chlorophenolicum]
MYTDDMDLEQAHQWSAQLQRQLDDPAPQPSSRRQQILQDLEDVTERIAYLTSTHY